MEKLGGGGDNHHRGKSSENLNHHHGKSSKNLNNDDDEKIIVSSTNKDLSSGDHQGCCSSSRSSELSEEDEKKMENFYALIARSYRDLARDLRPAAGIRRSLTQPEDIYLHLNEEEGGRRKERRCSSVNNNNNEKKRMRIGSGAVAAADVQTPWIPTFEWEDFAHHCPIHFENNYSLLHSARSHHRDADESFLPPPPSLPTTTNDAKGASTSTGSLELDLTLRL